MAKVDLNGVTLDEVKRNSNSSYAASISSGEIYSVACRHSKNGNIVLVIEGKALTCKSFDGSSFTADGCILYNPPLTRAIVEACDDTDTPVFIIKGVVTKTAPAPSKPSSDKVTPKAELEKEKDEIQKNFFSLKGKEKTAAEARLAAIETLLKTA